MRGIAGPCSNPSRPLRVPVSERETKFPSDESLELAKVAQYYDVIAGRGALRDELHAIFNQDFEFTPLHQYLAEIPAPLLILTTNYDDLIERAFSNLNPPRPYDVVIHTSEPEYGEQILWRSYEAPDPKKVNPNELFLELSETTVVYKMHGTVDRQKEGLDQYVITEDDYIEFLARMTKRKAIPSIFAEPLQSRHFLFLGYGLWDWNLRVVLNRIDKDVFQRSKTKRTKDIKYWSIQSEVRPIEQRFWQERGVEVFKMEIEEFVEKLRAS